MSTDPYVTKLKELRPYFSGLPNLARAIGYKKGVPNKSYSGSQMIRYIEEKVELPTCLHNQIDDLHRVIFHTR